MCVSPEKACNFSTSQLQKVVRECSALYIFTCKCASRHSGVQFFDISTSKSDPELTCFVHFHLHSGVQFFDISTSKSGPKLTCFVHFHFKMCLAPQPRAIFQHLNFKKCSETVSFLTFLLGNVLRATAACNFSTSQLQKVGADVFCTFSLENVLLATAACNFSTSQLQKVVRN